MDNVDIPFERLLEFSVSLDAALALARQKHPTKAVLVVARPGAGKSVLAKAYVALRPEVQFIEMARDPMFTSTRPLLEATSRRAACIVDEPRLYANLAEFLSAPGAPVILLAQRVEDAALWGLTPAQYVRVDVTPWRQWSPAEPDAQLLH